MAEPLRPRSGKQIHYVDAPEGGFAPHFSPGAPGDTLSVPSAAPPSTPEAAVSLERVADVELEVSIELGRAEMTLAEVAQLQSGAVVPLDKLAGDPVDVVVNGRMIARGEVVVVDGNFCVRVLELVTGAKAA